MSRARELSRLGNINVLSGDDVNSEVGIASTVPRSTLDVRGELQVGTGIQVGPAGVITATSFDGALGGNIVAAACTFTTGTFNGNVTIGGTLTYEDVTNVDALGIVTARAGVNVSGGQLLVGSGVTIGNAGVATFSGTSDIHLKDNVRLNVGDASDLAIYHDGNNSKIVNNTSGNLTLNATASEAGIDITPNAEVELYYNGSKKFETTNDGTVTTGIATATGVDVTSNLTVGSGITMGSAGVATFSGTSDVHIVDNVQLNFGNAKEGDIYRDSVQMIINNDGGNLKVRSASVHIAGLSNEKHIVSNTGVGVTLFHNNSAKFETVSTGCSVYGNLATNGDFTITGDSTNSIQLRVVPNEKNLVAIANGATELYYDNVKTFSTFADGITVQAGNNSNASIKLNADQGDDNDDLWRLEAVASGSEFYIKNYADGAWASNLKAVGDAGVHLYYNDSVVCYTDTDALRLNDSKYIKLGSSQDLQLIHDGSDSYISHGSVGHLFIRTASTDKAIKCVTDGGVELHYDDAKKLATTNDGVSITGIATVSQGMHFQGLLREKCNITANKVSAVVNINLSDGMVHYFSSNETTTATPNIRFDSTAQLNNKMSIGEAVTVTIIYKPNNAGYYANLTVDSSAVTEYWNGGDAPSSANSGGFDVLTHTLVKNGNGSFIVLSNVQNYAT